MPNNGSSTRQENIFIVKYHLDFNVTKGKTFEVSLSILVHRSAHYPTKEKNCRCLKTSL